jgi:predicted transcriptional regulator with HTH domain
VKNIHYVVGNHDYCLLGLNERYGGNYPFSVSKSLRLENGGKKYYRILKNPANIEIFNT